MTNILEIKNVSKYYKQGGEKLEVLTNVNFNIEQGTMLALLGSSGSGKSTLLNIIGMLDEPNSGDVFINNIKTKHLNDDEKTKLRGENIGFVFQFHHLLPDFTAIENVMMPLIIHGQNKNIAYKEALNILTKLGLKHRINHLPSKLSGGEQQRVAIARAVCFKPKLLIADEPTGNLDSKNAREVFELLLNLVKEYNTTAIIATHDLNVASLIERKIKIENSTIVEA